jgi:protein-S-isoprenylcysteine O-methyltransferase Ste14
VGLRIQPNKKPHFADGALLFSQSFDPPFLLSIHFTVLRPPAMMKSLLSLAAKVLGAVAYLGLAVMGKGGFTAFFSNPALIALAAVFFALTVVAFFAGGNISPGVREDRRNRWVLPAFFGVGFAAAFFPAFADREGFWVIGGNSIRWVGVILAGAGGALRLWPVFVLGDRFSGLVAIQPGHTLVTNGVYRFIRHPSYVGLMINSVGWGMAFNTWIGILFAVALLPPLIARIHAEEKLLLSQFGNEYADFCKHTWKLIPSIY